MIELGKKKLNNLARMYGISCDIGEDGILIVKTGQVFSEICNLLHWDYDEIKQLTINYVLRKIIRETSVYSKDEIEMMVEFGDFGDALVENYIENIEGQDVPWEYLEKEFTKHYKTLSETFNRTDYKSTAKKHMLSFINEKGIKVVKSDKSGESIYIQKNNLLSSFFFV